MPPDLKQIDILLNEHSLRKARLEKILAESSALVGTGSSEDLYKVEDADFKNQNSEL